MTNRAMSDSNVKWIGDIPNNWSVEPIGKLFTERNTKVSDLDFPPLSVTKKGIVPQLENAAKSKNHNDRKQVNSGDFVINSRSDRKMSSGLSSLDGSVSLINIVLTSKSVFPGYTKYLLKNYGFAEEFYRWGTGIVADLWSTRYERMKRILVPYPSYEEQQKIATFLDEKVAHIDNIIEDTKKSIENLKAYKQSLITETVTKGLDPNVEMKDSGIDWVGKIPKHWMLRKIKHLTSKIGSGKTPRGGGNIYSNEGILFLRSQNIYETGLYLENATYISPEIDDSMKSTRVYSNDVLLNITGGSIGRACVYPQYIETHANVNQHVCILRPIQEYTHPSYLFYYLISHVGRNYIRYYQTGGNREGLNFEQIGNFAIPSFSIHEQTKIVNYLDEKTSQVDQIVNQQKQLVKEFESYKRSIIYEYVTGKKEVK